VDRAIRVAWYDVPEAGRGDYLTWLHGESLPALLTLPGCLWAAHYECVDNQVPPGRVRHVSHDIVPAGNAYVLIIGAEDAHVFVRQKISEAPALRALRRGERVQIFTEEARLAGPSASRREGRWMPAPCIQIGSFCTANFADDEGVLDWYVHNRMAAMRDTPGCFGVRKYVSVTGWAKHGVLYEFESLALRNRHFMRHANASAQNKAWSDQLVPSLIHAPGSPNVACRLWPPAK
jgi:hypothetical protein